MLLDTRMRYGNISYKAEDVTIWDLKWQPSERTVQDLEQQWKTIRVAKVQFVANAVGGVFCHVFEVKSPNTGVCSWLTSMIAHSPRIAVFTGACLLGLIIFGFWQISAWRQGEPNVDDYIGQN